MDSKILESEKKTIEKWFQKEPDYDLCQLELTELNDPWCNKQTLDIVSKAFHYQNWADQVPTLHKNIAKNQKIINERITEIELHGVKYLLKREEYSKASDNSIHEFFVGLELNKLRNECPCFAGMIATFGCLPKEGKVCQAYGDRNYSFVLYQYIPGKTLYRLYLDGDIDVDELWNLVQMSYFACEFAFIKIKFIHQDLHLMNIICRPLNQFYEVRFGEYSFTVRYLPTIIDFARSQVIDESHSPEIPYLNIPGQDNFFDLNYILNFFSAIIKDNILSEFQLYEKVNDDKILKIFKEYRAKYSKDYNSKDILTISAEIPTVKYDSCEPLEKINDTEAIEYIKLMKRKDILTDLIVAKKINESTLNEYLDILLLYEDEISADDLAYLNIMYFPKSIKGLIDIPLSRFDYSNDEKFKSYYKNIIFYILSNYPEIGPKLIKIYNITKDQIYISSDSIFKFFEI